MKLRHAIALLVGAYILYAPAMALACPVCAADNDKTTLKVAAAFLAVPFILSFFVIRAIVRAQRAE